MDEYEFRKVHENRIAELIERINSRDIEIARLCGENVNDQEQIRRIRELIELYE